jgi:hypothetical protein
MNSKTEFNSQFDASVHLNVFLACEKRPKKPVGAN